MTDKEKRLLLKRYPSIFDAAVERLQNSPNPEEREWIFLGFSLDGRHAVLMPRDMLFKHAHILGDPGSGKTAKWLTPVTSQLIASGEVSVVILDMKNDLGMLHNAVDEADTAGLLCKLFTTRIGASSHIWNPWNEPYLLQMSNTQRAQTIMAALGISFGEAYGKSFFTSSQKLVLKKIVERYGDSIHSFADLHRYCADQNAYKGLGPREDWLNSRHLVSVLEFLAELMQLNATAKDLPPGSKAIAQAITVEEVLTRPTVVYFSLPATIDASQSTSLARLFLFALMNAASIYQPERKTVKVVCIADEGQLLATQGLPLILNQCRSFGIGLAICHQSIDQLKSNGNQDLTQIVLSSTVVKQIFRSSDLLSRDYLIKTGGDAMYHKLSWQQPLPVHNGEPVEDWISPSEALPAELGGHPLVNVQEEKGPWLEPNTIMEASADPALSLVNFTGDEGPVQYKSAWNTVISGFHIDKDTYDRRMNTPWPPASDDEGTIVVPREWKPSPGPPPGPPPKPVDDFERRIRESEERRKRNRGR